MERIQVILSSGMGMSLHGGEWRIHASAVDDGKVIEDALSWLSGSLSDILVHKENSTLGAPMKTISVKMKGKQAELSLKKMEEESLDFLIENGVGNRVDKDKFLHIRLRLDRLVQGRAVVSKNSDEPVAKGKFKLEVYPGQEAIVVAEDFLMRLIGE